jgi:hypothetical protein
MNELEVTEEQVRKERLKAVDQRAHWGYLVAVLGGSIALMLALIALLDAVP